MRRILEYETGLHASVQWKGADYIENRLSYLDRNSDRLMDLELDIAAKHQASEEFINHRLGNIGVLPEMYSRGGFIQIIDFGYLEMLKGRWL